MDTPNLCLARVRCLFVGLKLLHKRIRIILSYQTCSSRGFVTLTDQSLRILAYRYQQGILAPQIPLGGAFSLVFRSTQFRACFKNVSVASSEVHFCFKFFSVTPREVIVWLTGWQKHCTLKALYPGKSVLEIILIKEGPGKGTFTMERYRVLSP